MDSKANAKRELILNAATQIALDSGFHSLTLDAVAKRAGISKGGLLYHYPNKDLLIKGIAIHIFDEFYLNFEDFSKKDPVEKGKWSRALIEASKFDLEHNAELNVGISAAALLNSAAVHNISESYQSILSKLEDDGIDPVTATIIRLALDGLYYSQLLNVAPVDKDMQKAVFQKLVKMTNKEE
ncbi:TetR/AcrR family transcriptional regulator [Cytobacillus praedii]|uniref:TetR/AcrR family transcriptional regulator n=1 Tax=Cytobacillus praedii TaxID=1742358 RepID=UPI0007098D22|nr:TetR family transcriptional regulator [Cytobacillus praedii]